MTTVTIIIKDEGDSVQLEVRLEDPSALQKMPTAALIIGSYLAANAERVCKDAITWFGKQPALLAKEKETEQ
jgi:hypothetical protein